MPQKIENNTSAFVIEKEDLVELKEGHTYRLLSRPFVYYTKTRNFCVIGFDYTENKYNVFYLFPGEYKEIQTIYRKEGDPTRYDILYNKNGLCACGGKKEFNVTINLEEYGRALSDMGERLHTEYETYMQYNYTDCVDVEPLDMILKYHREAALTARDTCARILNNLSCFSIEDISNMKDELKEILLKNILDIANGNCGMFLSSSGYRAKPTEDTIVAAKWIKKRMHLGESHDKSNENS